MTNNYSLNSEDQISRARELLFKQPLVTELSSIFQKGGFQLYIVGGSVRDAFLGKTHDDFDFTTNASPETTIKLVNDYADELWKIGIDFGTIGIEKRGLKAEITTFRSDNYDESSRKPDVLFEANITTDLSRRDFTFNAMAFKLPDGTFVDEFDGLDDLGKRVLKTPVDPDISFNDDPLRMLRAIRFISTLVVLPSDEVVASIVKLKSRLEIVSSERVQAELSKLLTGIAPSQGIYHLISTGLTDIVLPEITELASCVDPEHRHKDLLEHTMTVMDNMPPELELRLAALLHDIGKPRTKSMGADGIHFYHHEAVGAKMASRRLKSLKYPTSFIADVVKMIEMHMRFHTYRLGWADSAVRRYIRDCGPLIGNINKLVRADCTTRNPFQSRKFKSLLDELDERIIVLEEEEESAKIRPPIDGTEVMNYLGLKPGPEVGRVMKALLEARIDGEITTKEDAYALIDKEFQIFNKNDNSSR